MIWGSILGRIISMSETGIENPGNLRCKAIKHKLISLYLQTKAFYESARIAKILNGQQWRLGATGIWKG